MSQFSSFRFFSFLLVFEIIAGVNAALVFRIFPPAKAGMLAGSMFFGIGVLAFCLIKIRAVWRKKISLIVAGIYLFVFALPLFLARIVAPADEALTSVFGLPLIAFHQGSQLAFAALFLITFLQVIFAVPRGKSSNGDRDNRPPHY